MGKNDPLFKERMMAYSCYMKRFLPALLIVLFFVSSASAEPKTRVVTLQDGTTVQGKILGIDNGSYIVQNPVLGELRVKEGDVVSILSPGESLEKPSQKPSRQGGTDELQVLQSRIMGNPEIMADIQAIASDPELVALISNPAFMQAAQAKDIAAMQANPRTAKLMSNPKIKALIEKIQALEGQ